MVAGPVAVEFDIWLREVYPDPPTPGSEQYLQVQRAYFGGAACYAQLVEGVVHQLQKVSFVGFLEQLRREIATEGVVH